MGILRTLHPGDYHVTVVSADTFTTFTPLLPCTFTIWTPLGLSSYMCECRTSIKIFLLAAAVGTVQVRSLVEPIRKIIARLRGHFVQGHAVDLVMSERLLEVQTTSTDGTKSSVYLPYGGISAWRLFVLIYLNSQLRQTRDCRWLHV